MKRYSNKRKTAVSHASYTDAVLRNALIRLNNKEADKLDHVPLTPKEMRFFRNTQVETLKLIRKNTMKLRFLQANRVAAAILLCVLLSFSVCCAAFPQLRSLLSKFVLSKGDHYTNVPLESDSTASYEPVIASTEECAFVPADWKGTYYPTYIPEGFEISYISDASGYVTYQNAVQKTLIFEELEGVAGDGLDMEGSDETEILLNGQLAILSEGAGDASIFWTVEDRYFLLTFQGETDEAIRIAESVRKIR